MLQKFIFLIIMLFSGILFAGGLDDYLNVVSSQCHSTNRLIIKKSLIELTQGQDCKSSFTALLLKDCPRLSCTLLNGYLSSLVSTQNGAVIGK